MFLIMKMPQPMRTQAMTITAKIVYSLSILLIVEFVSYYNAIDIMS